MLYHLYVVSPSENQLRRPLVSDHLSLLVPNFPKYQKIQSQIIIFRNTCKRSPHVSDRNQFSS